MHENRFIIIGLLLLSLAVVLAGCSSGGGDDSTGDGGGGGTAAATNEQASGAGQATNLSSGSYDTFSNLGNIGLTATGGAPAFKLPGHMNKDAGLKLTSTVSSRISTSKAVQQATSAVKAARSKATPIDATNWACEDGGTFTLTEVQAGVSYSIVFNQCREADEQYNGTYTMTATATGFTFSIGSTGNPLTILSFDNNYATLIASLEAIVTLAWDVPNASTISMTGNGTISATDYISGNDYSMTYTNFVETFSLTQSGGNFILSLLTNGSFSESWTEAGTSYSVSISFTSFAIDVTLYSNGDDATEISGSATVTFTPSTFCTGGTFSFVTDVPVYWSDAAGHTTAGQVTINSGAIVLVWNANGSITVTDSSGSTTYANDYELFEECDFAVVGEDAPPSSGSGGTASGSAMTVTLSWTGGDTSDMDLHMNYYNTTTPTGTTQGTAYVDWHNSLVDLNGDGTTDAELDYDDVEGYGPEHITTGSLPVGYYVISVNSFSLDLDPSANVSVTIQIGGTTFGPYNNTFTTSDGESQTVAAWFAVADVVVDGSGSVTVQAHDPALELWHDGAFGLFAPRAAKKIR